MQTSYQKTYSKGVVKQNFPRLPSSRCFIYLIYLLVGICTGSVLYSTNGIEQGDDVAPPILISDSYCVFRKTLTFT